MKIKVLIFLSLFSLYFFSWLLVNKTKINDLVIQSEDTVPAIVLPAVIVKEHTLYLDNYKDLMYSKYPNPDDKDYANGLVPFYLKKVGTHYLSAFTIITPVISVPIYYVASLLGFDFDFQNLIVISHICAALIVSLCGVIFYSLVKDHLDVEVKHSLLLTGVFSVATINYAQISQAMWQHGTVQLFSLLAVIVFLKFEKSKAPNFLIYFGLFSGIAILSRPTAVLVLAVLGSYLVFNKNFLKNSLLIGVGLLLPLVFFIWYNARFYIGIENQGYTSQLFKNWLGDFPLSFAGVWLSPSKGILVYSPVLAFSLLGIYYSFKNKAQPIFKLSFIIVFLHTLVISFWKHWFGGWSFGYRMSSDVIPFMVLLIIPWLQSQYSVKYFKVFMFTLVFSVLVQFSGIVFFDGVWHAKYDKGFKDTSWLWSIKDSEIVFNIRRVLVKAKVLDSPF